MDSLKHAGFFKVFTADEKSLQCRGSSLKTESRPHSSVGSFQEPANQHSSSLIIVLNCYAAFTQKKLRSSKKKTYQDIKTCHNLAFKRMGVPPCPCNKCLPQKKSSVLFMHMHLHAS